MLSRFGSQVFQVRRSGICRLKPQTCWNGNNILQKYSKAYKIPSQPFSVKVVHLRFFFLYNLVLQQQWHLSVWVPRKRREDLGQGSSVRVSMVTAVPMTPGGSGEVKGHRLQRRVQLSPCRPRHLAAAKSYFHRTRGTKRGGRGGGKTRQVFILKEKKKQQPLHSDHVV